MGAYIALAAEPTNGQPGQFKRSITVHDPILAVEEFAVGSEFIDQSETCTNVRTNLAGDVEAGPVGFT